MAERAFIEVIHHVRRGRGAAAIADDEDLLAGGMGVFDDGE